MKKHFLAASCCMVFSIPVLAQSNVQIYGIVDGFVEYGKIRGDKVMGLGEGGWNGSRIGFRGEEDLGNGIKALFVLEEGLDIGTGKSFYMSGVDSQENSGSDVFTRQAFVGLKGAFGQVGLGRQYSPGYFMVAYDPMQGFGWSPVLELLQVTGLTHLNSGYARWNNSISYTGAFQSLTLRGIYSSGNRETDTGNAITNKYSKSDDDKYGIGAEYSSGPLSGAFAYTAIKYKYKPEPDNSTFNEWSIGLSYNMNFATLMGTYKKGTDVQGHDGLDVDLWSLGVMVPYGQSKFYASYTQSKIDADYANTGSYKPKAFSLSYFYWFSKRTSTYIGYTNTNYDNMRWGDITRFKLSLPGGLNGHYANDKIDHTNLVAIGLSHQF